MTFTIGSRVTWRSQAGGTWIEKAGAVVVVVPAKTRGWVALAGAGESARPPGWGGTHRDEESYIVRADNGRLYWPRASALRAAGTASANHVAAGIVVNRDEARAALLEIRDHVSAVMAGPDVSLDADLILGAALRGLGEDGR